MATSARTFASERREDRTEVHHRVTMLHGSQPVTGLIVNISPNGLMVRCHLSFEVGARLTFRLLGMPPLPALVRWTLGGRIGCEFERSFPPSEFDPLLARLRR